MTQYMQHMTQSKKSITQHRGDKTAPLEPADDERAHAKSSLPLPSQVLATAK
jgi:hypothetical protein